MARTKRLVQPSEAVDFSAVEAALGTTAATVAVTLMRTRSEGYTDAEILSGLQRCEQVGSSTAAQELGLNLNAEANLLWQLFALLKTMNAGQRASLFNSVRSFTRNPEP